MRTFLKHLLNQPLFHFLIAGGLLFAFFGWVNRAVEDSDANRIVVDRSAVLNQLQYRNRAFNNKAALSYLENMPAAEYSRLVDEYVREEALYREAKKMELDMDDYIIKRRLIQKMEYLARGFGLDQGDVSEEELVDFYTSHQSRYEKPPAITFTHVFVDKTKPDAEQRATALLEQLNRENISFSGAMGFGDRFIYHRNYVEKDEDFIASQFGGDFAQQVFEVDGKEGQWLGPLHSEYGYHLVMISAREEGGVPSLQELRETVYRDLLDDRQNQQAEEFIEKIISNYDVVADDTVNASSGKMTSVEKGL